MKRFYSIFVLMLIAAVGAWAQTDVSTFAQLQSALDAGNDVRLTSNISFTSAITISGSKKITINGNGKTLSGPSTRAFTINSGNTLAVKNATLNNFDLNAGGGAIRNNGTLVLDGCTVSNNHTDGSNQGGGAIENQGTLYASNTTFSGNYSSEIGGAINNYMGKLYLSDCTFTNNYTTSSNAKFGGAIGNNSSNTVVIVNCTFSGNKYNGSNGSASDLGVYRTPNDYTIAGCTGITITGGTLTTYPEGSVSLDFSDLNNIKFVPSTSVVKYDITLSDESTAHGTVAITVGGTAVTTAKKDDVVTISVTPNSGYSTKDVTVRAYTSWGGAAARGNRAPALQDEIDVTAGQTSGTWTFTMPGANVWVVVTYTKNLQDSWIQTIATQYYTGSAIEPTVIVKDGNATLTEGTDYTVAFENNVEVGTANVIVTAVSGSNYSGTANATFIIERAENKLLSELYEAIGTDVWTGYGEQTGVISYSRGDDPKEFRATYMGGLSTIDLPFDAFTSASKVDNGDGSYTYTLVVNLPAQTGMSQETLHVTMKNGEITGMDSENAGLDLNKEISGITDWAALQTALTNGGVIKLTQNITATSTDAALTVPQGKTVVLELNGFTINRNLTEATANGSVIINNGTLATTDTEGGKIIGGNTTGNGGGILNNGTLTLYAGEITGNKASGQGGGVYNTITNTDTEGFWMTGGLIDGNTADSYPAIGGNVTFNSMAAIQISAEGTKVSIAKAKAGMATYSYIMPVMPDPDHYYVVAATLTIPAKTYASYISDKGLELGMGTADGVLLTSVKAVDAYTGTVTLFDNLESAAAQTPLILYNGTDEDQMVDLIVNENGAEVNYDAEHFFGTLEPKTFTPDDMAEADHYVLDGHNFTWVKDAGTLPANRCWLKIIPPSTTHARTMNIIFEGDVTGISTVKTATSIDGNFYDLSGRRVTKPTKGLYIVNGKKVVMK